MPRKREKTYLIDLTTNKAVGYTYSRDNARRWVTITPEYTARDSLTEHQKNGKLPYLGKLSTLRVLMYLFTDGYIEDASPEGYSMDDLQRLIAGASDTSLITALTDMKNPRWTDKPIRARKIRGRYVRQ